jgi:hypothetical protein
MGMRLLMISFSEKGGVMEGRREGEEVTYRLVGSLTRELEDKAIELWRGDESDMRRDIEQIEDTPLNSAFSRKPGSRLGIL